MANKEIFFRGKVKWFKLQNQGDSNYKCWSTVLYLTPESVNQFQELKKGTDTVEGLLNELKQDEDGHFITLKRPWFRKLRDGSEVGMQPPIILSKENLPWPTDKAIGNGSDVTIKCDYYTFKAPFKTKRGSAIRLVSARIEDLVPYEPKKDFTDKEAKVVGGLVDQKPPQYF